MSRRQCGSLGARCDGVWRFEPVDRSQPTARSIAEHAESRLRNLAHRELDLVFRLSVLYERRELYPDEVTDRQVAELDRRLDEIRAQIERARAELPVR